MRDLLRLAIVPGFILLCLVLGGSAQGIWTNAALQLGAVAIIAWALLARPAPPLSDAARGLAMIAGLTVLLIGLQLVPLPAALWTALPGRDFVVEGLRLIGAAPGWSPLSLTPHATMDTALTLLPPLAVLVAMLWTGAYRGAWLAVAILAVILAAVLLGALQVGSADPLTSQWYLYRRTNHGVATGFFANSNHMGALLVIGVPILFALARDLRDRATNVRAKSAILLLAVSGVLVLLLGIVLNESLAVLLLGPPVVLASATILLPRQASLRWPLAGIAVLGGLATLAAYVSPLHDRIVGGNMTSIEERQVMWANTASAIPDFLPWGSGVGSFATLYPRYEAPETVTPTFNSHAHNDYLEIALETGAPGILLLIVFLIWWGARTRSIWSSTAADPYAQAATIVTAALLLHSMVDYPLRTAALSAVMAAFLAIMARPRAPRPRAEADLWPTRHARI